jgi:hypothetical protein
MDPGVVFVAPNEENADDEVSEVFKNIKFSV